MRDETTQSDDPARAREANDGGAVRDSEVPSDDELPNLDRLIGTFLREPSLWPVLVVVLGSGGAFTAAMLVLAFVDRNLFAAAALLLLLGMTLDVVFRARSRPSYRSGALLLALVWASGLAFAALAVWSGIAFTG